MTEDLKLRRLTSMGRGAVAVLEVQTSQGDLLTHHFRAANGMSAASAAVNRILYGMWGSEDVVVVRTASTEWEVHCHGGEAAVTKIAHDLQASAATKAMRLNLNVVTSTDTASGGDTKRPSVGQPDVLPAIQEPFISLRESERPNESLHDQLLQQLLKCRTRKTAAFLLAQQQGLLQSFLGRLQGHHSDHPLRNDVQRFLQWTVFATHLTEPWQVAIVGQPNAGKSSLLNSIVGFDRSIVYDQPGTTRDRVEADIVLQDWPIRMVDTAGIRELLSDSIEMAGVTSARTSLQESDACLLVVDAITGLTANDLDLLASVPGSTPVAILLNKIDLAKDAQHRSQIVSNARAELVRALPDSAARITSTICAGPILMLATSATSREGLDPLLEWLPAVLVPCQPEFTEPLPVLPEAIDLATDWLQPP